MAKKKATKKKETTKKETKKKSEEKKTLDDLFREKFGQGVIVGGNYITEKDKKVIPVSPMVDFILNGGIKFGSFCIFTGPPKVGKTSLSLDMAGSALDIPTQFDVPRKLFFFNIEARLNDRDLMGIKHLAPKMDEIGPDGTPTVRVIQSEAGNIITAENFLEMGEAYINNYPGSIFIFDSFSQLCSQKGHDKEWDDKEYRDNVPKMLSQFCKRVSNAIPVNESVLVGITHRISDTGPSFSPWAEASGNKIQYAVDVKLKATHCKSWMEEEVCIGQDVYWECLCSSLQNGPVNTKAISKFRYGYGVDKAAELLPLAVDLAIIEKGGSWYTIGDQKVQGLEKASQILNEDKELFDSINKQYREAMDFPC